MNTVVERLAWMLLHSLWQGAAGWIGLQLSLLALQRHAARLRYFAGCVALVFVRLAPWVTFFCLDVTSRLEPQAPAQANASVVSASLTPLAAPPARLSSVAVGTNIAPTAPNSRPRMQAVFRQCLPWLVRAWAVGCCFYLVRLAYDYRATRRVIASDTAPATDALRRLFDQTCRRLGLTRVVALKMSHRVDVPAVIGWLKPVVLVPSGALQNSRHQAAGLRACRRWA